MAEGTADTGMFHDGAISRHRYFEQRPFNRTQPTFGPRNVTFGAQVGPRRVTL